MSRCALLALACLWAAAAATAGEAAVSGSPSRINPASGKDYGLTYQARFEPEAGTVSMRVAIVQTDGLVREVDFAVEPGRYRDFEADGALVLDAGRVRWQPPPQGGSIRFAVVLDHQRGGSGYDSLMRGDWAVFRGDDLFPPATVRSVKGAQSKARLCMQGPEDWSFLTAYPKLEEEPGCFQVDWADRRFDRPVGWMAAGRLGARWTRIGDRRLGVAGPMGQGVRHLDILAFLRWNLPALVKVFPRFPDRVLVVSAGDPMWRGGLSGPNSLYLHADRPLISGNGTSTLLHELVHVAQGYRAVRDDDWIVEGIAEYYTLEIMRRTGTISTQRYQRGMEKLEQWGADTAELGSQRSAGSRTARSVLVMQELEVELRAKTGGKHGLDDVARQLTADDRAVTLARLREVSAQLAGGPLDSLSPERLGRD